jgi:hypothetical protein
MLAACYTANPTLLQALLAEGASPWEPCGDGKRDSFAVPLAHLQWDGPAPASADASNRLYRVLQCVDVLFGVPTRPLSSYNLASATKVYIGRLKSKGRKCPVVQRIRQHLVALGQGPAIDAQEHF